MAPTSGCLRLPGLGMQPRSLGFCHQMKWSLFHVLGTPAQGGGWRDSGSLLELAGLGRAALPSARSCWPGFLPLFETPCKLRPLRFVWTRTLQSPAVILH